MYCSKWEKQLLRGILGKFKRQQPDFSIIWKLSSAKILWDTLSTASQLELRRRKKGPWRIWSVFSRQTICGKERKEGESRGGIEEGERRWGLHLWHRAESISHEFRLWAFITLVRPLKSHIREDLHTRWLWRWSSACKPDKWLSRWAFTTYVSLFDAMKGPHASESTILAFLVSGAASAVKQNERTSQNRSRQAEDRLTIRQKAEGIHVR